MIKYTLNEIIEIGNILKELKGKTILNNSNFFKLIDYDIKSIEVEFFRLFNKNKNVNMYYIDFMIFSSSDEEIKYNSEDYKMCSKEGINILLDYRDNFILMNENYNSFLSPSNKNMFISED